MKDLVYPSLLPALEEKVVRKPYKRALKIGKLQAQEQENHIESHNVEFKLPPIESPKFQNFSSNDEFGNRMKFFIDFGFKPNGPLSYEELMKYQRAKKRLITLSDFMSKRAQKQILTSELFSCNENTKEVKLKKKRNSLIDIKAKTSRHINFDLAKSCEDLQSADKETHKRDKQQELQKIDEILNFCDNLLQRTPHNNAKLF